MSNFKVKKEIIAIVAAAVIGLYLYFVLIPSARVAASLYSQATRLYKDVQAAERDKSDIRRLEDQQGRLKAQLAQYETKLLDASEVDTILSEISKEAIDAGAKIAFIEPLKTEGKDKTPIQGKGEAFVSYPVQLGMKASYHRLGIFINRLETSDRLIKINDISIKSDSSDMYNHNASILIEAYVTKK